MQLVANTEKYNFKNVKGKYTFFNLKHISYSRISFLFIINTYLEKDNLFFIHLVY